MQDQKSEEERNRITWFEGYVDALEHRSVTAPEQKGVKYRCPCCGYKTLNERGGYDICAVCFWEDDGQDDEDADTVRGGPSACLSLTKALENYRNLGACEERFVETVRLPLPEEEV